MSEYKEGQTATSKDRKSRIVFRGGQWVNDDTFAPKAKTSATDQKALQEYMTKAATERDMLRQYKNASEAVDTMGTGPFNAWLMDAVTPQPEGGVWDSIGGVIGSPIRWAYSNERKQARDHLKTVEADASIAASTALKGPATDRDMGLIRLTGVNPYKTKRENKRIINDASYQAGLEQVRAQSAAAWINKYGSLTAPSRSGKSFAEILALGEREYRDRMTGKKKPKAPPSAKRGSSRVTTVDINGNPVQ